MYKTDFSIPKGAKIPQATGYRLMIMMPLVEEKTAGGIIRPDSTAGREQTASIVGKVIQAGPDAFRDKDKFPTGPWCNVGDFVMFRAYSGTKFDIGNREFRIINDDTVEAVVDDITQITRK